MFAATLSNVLKINSNHFHVNLKLFLDTGGNYTVSARENRLLLYKGVVPHIVVIMLRAPECALSEAGS